MINPQILPKILSDTFQSPIKTVACEKLPGDASNRRYYRLEWRQNGTGRSAILMEMAKAESAKISDEAGSEPPSTVQELPFIDIQKHLLACKIPVPEIYLFDEARGWILLEDLGEATLADVLGDSSDTLSRATEYYQRAIDALVSIQHEATPQQGKTSIAHRRRFDRNLFEWEFEHFIEYGIEARNGIALDREKRIALQSIFSEISTELAALPQVFTHRDYHSRNLMIDKDPTGFKLGIIDFQDALMGPPHYDLASLLRDSYIDLPEETIDHLLDYYFKLFESRSGKSIDRASFRTHFDLMSIQRNLKAAGRFIFIDKVKKKDHLLRFVTPTLLKVKRNLTKYEHLKPLRRLLASVVLELQ